MVDSEVNSFRRTYKSSRQELRVRDGDRTSEGIELGSGPAIPCVCILTPRAQMVTDTFSARLDGAYVDYKRLNVSNGLSFHCS